MKRLSMIMLAAALSVHLSACDLSLKSGVLPEELTKIKEPSEYYTPPLSSDDESDTKEGAAKYGAVIKLGELDALGRSTYAHIRLTDVQEPGSNGEERAENINVDPAGWENFKLDGEWVNNRCHLIGYQFSGLNDELRNLATGTGYVNKGALGNGTDEDNPDCMLYYEQRLDDWLHEHDEYALDLYVKPVYVGSDLTPEAFYMQWVGIDENESWLPIEIGGHSQKIEDVVHGVVLQNQIK